jgi:DNA-directed RNA polymerase subunit RPC12/RpoP
MAQLKCGKCGKSFDSERELNEHEMTCKGGSGR